MSEYERPIVTVDVVALTLRAARLSVLLRRRDREPFKNRLALPGGYVHVDEDVDVEATARRVLSEKVGAIPPFIEQLFTFSGPMRDARGWSVSIAFIAILKETAVTTALEREDLTAVDVDQLPPMPFDHRAIIETAVQRLRSKSTYSSLPVFFLPETFSLRDLQEVYEQVLRTTLHRGTFRRKIFDQNMVEPIEGMVETQGGRPAQLYRMTQAALHDFGRQIITELA